MMVMITAVVVVVSIAKSSITLLQAEDYILVYFHTRLNLVMCVTSSATEWWMGRKQNSNQGLDRAKVI